MISWIRRKNSFPKRKICILLTACVDLKRPIFRLKRKDPLVREKDYIEAMKAWINKTDYSIVFCENSGFDLVNIRKVAQNSRIREGRDVEFLQFDGQNFPGELGRGYGELGAIRYAIMHSTLIKKSDYVIKVTGRLFIKNIKKITQPLLKENEFYVMASLMPPIRCAECRIFAFKPSFVPDYFAKFQGSINDSKDFVFDRALYEAITLAINDGRKWLPLPSKPVIVGHSAS